MADRVKVELGAVQQTLFIPLAARARETRRRRPVLQDPKAAEILASVDFDAKKYGRGWGGHVTVLRTAILDCWVSDFLTEHPGGTVVEIGTGLNTRFDRADNGQAHWIDLDLPDTIELRRRFFANSGRQRMVAASVLDQDWLPDVRACPAPYFFAAEGVLAYLDQAPQVIARIARGFPGALIAFVLEMYERLVEKRTVQPTFYRDFPVEVSPLVRQHRSDPRLAERWDLVAFGAQLGTGYSELVDPVVQRARLTAQSLLKADGDPEAMELDEDFLHALEYGMPPTGGMGMGIDRLLMTLTGQNIRETLLFPFVRPD